MKHVEFHAKNKFAKLVQLVGLIIKKFVTMYGHMNVKILHYLRQHVSTFMESSLEKFLGESIFFVF